MDEDTQTTTLPSSPSDSVSSSAPDAGTNAAVDAATQIDFLIKQFITELDEIKEKLKEQRSMVKDAIITNVEYKDADDGVKAANKRKKEIANVIADQASVRQAQEQIRSLQESAKTIEKKLSSYLKQYVDTFNTRTIEDAQGRLKEIVTLYKLVAKTSE